MNYEHQTQKLNYQLHLHSSFQIISRCNAFTKSRFSRSPARLTQIFQDPVCSLLMLSSRNIKQQEVSNCCAHISIEANRTAGGRGRWTTKTKSL